MNKLTHLEQRILDHLKKGRKVHARKLAIEWGYEQDYVSGVLAGLYKKGRCKRVKLGKQYEYSLATEKWGE